MIFDLTGLETTRHLICYELRSATYEGCSQVRKPLSAIHVWLPQLLGATTLRRCHTGAAKAGAIICPQR